MSKIKTALLALLAAILLIFICMGATVTASADNVQPVGQTEQEETVDPDISLDEAQNDGVEAKFIELLKAKYGEDYEYYYNRIISQWGSIEAYLLSLGNKLPEEHRSPWRKFVGWLDEYSVIWAPALAVILIICVGVIGKKQFNKLVEKVVSGKVSPINDELNKQSAALVTIMHTQKLLLPKTEQFSETASELESAEKELKG